MPLPPTHPLADADGPISSTCSHILTVENPPPDGEELETEDLLVGDETTVKGEIEGNMECREKVAITYIAE